MNRWEKKVNSEEVRQMFSKIASRYDLANTLLSGGMHFLWKKRLAYRIKEKALVLDLCTGTGDVANYLAKHNRNVVGADFCVPMLDVARRRNTSQNIEFVEADALQLSFDDESFDGATCAFGVRNLASLTGGLREIYRVVKKDAPVAILEFGWPRLPLFRIVYDAYARHIIPWIGKQVTGDRNAYEYLPETAQNFPAGEAFLQEMRQVGFRTVRATPLTGGIAYLYEGIK